MHYIKKLILEGEHQMLDFKFELSDSRKIARTLAAFANTNGGRLLVGVKDNGALAGVRSEEEIYMAEGAARLHCRPEVPISIKEWEVEGKTVVEIIVEPGRHKPHLAPDPEGKWKAYIRQQDENYLASHVQMLIWKRQQAGSDTMIRYREEEGILLGYLEKHGVISLGRFQKLAGITKKKAEAILVNFILLGFIYLRHEGDEVRFHLRESGSY
jgi:hypothetical protein